MTMKQISPKIRKATTIRMLVVKAPTSTKRALTIKALPALERPKDKPLPLASVYGKSEEEVSQIIQEWKSDNGAAALLEHLKAPDLVRIRQLLDWYVEGYSVQADSYEQLEIIKDMIAKDYRPGPDGTWIFSSPYDEPIPDKAPAKNAVIPAPAKKQYDNSRNPFFTSPLAKTPSHGSPTSADIEARRKWEAQEEEIEKEIAQADEEVKKTKRASTYLLKDGGTPQITASTHLSKDGGTPLDSEKSTQSKDGGKSTKKKKNRDSTHPQQDGGGTPLDSEKSTQSNDGGNSTK